MKSRTAVADRAARGQRTRGYARTAAGLCALCAATVLAVLHVTRLAGDERGTRGPSPFSLGQGSASAAPFGSLAMEPVEGSASDAAVAAVARKARASLLPAAVTALRGESAAHALDRLGALARRGDAQAAYDAYEIGDFCALADPLQDSLQRLPLDAQPEVRASIDDEARLRAGACRGTTPAQLGERFANIRSAAQSGVRGAAEEFLEAGIPGQFAGGDTRDPLAVQWQQQALEYLRRDAAQGDSEALSAMADLYRSGAIVPADPALAYAYQLAAAQALQAGGEATPGTDAAMAQEFAQRFAADVPEVDLARARAIAIELSRR